MKVKSFGKVAVLMGGRVGALSRGPACGDATAETRVAAARGMLFMEPLFHE